MSVELINRVLAGITDIEMLRAMKVAKTLSLTHAGVIIQNGCARILFTQSPEALVIKGDTLRHDSRNRSVTSVLFTHTSPDVYVSGIYKVSDLTLPEYKEITFADIVDLPTLDICTQPSKVVECVQDYLSIPDIGDIGNMFKYIQEQPDKFALECIIRYSQGDSGEYGYELHRVKYEGDLVAFLVINGGWPDDHELIPFGNRENYESMFSWIKENIIPEVPPETIYCKDSILELPGRLLDMISKQTYLIEETSDD